MSTTVRWSPGVKVLGVASQILTGASASNFDFGTPNDIDLTAESSYAPGDRIVVVFTGRAAAAQSTDIVTWAVQDADDNAGSIGTPATATTSIIDGALVGAVTEDTCVLAVKVTKDRPWLRCVATMGGTTDDYHVTAMVLAVPSNA